MNTFIVKFGLLSMLLGFSSLSFTQHKRALTVNDDQNTNSSFAILEDHCQVYENSNLVPQKLDYRLVMSSLP